MALNHGNMATHLPQSLPSFAQAFSTPSFNSMSSGSNALPPIQARHSSLEDTHRVQSRSPSVPDRIRRTSAESATAKPNGRKRSWQETTSAGGDDEASESDRSSPRSVRIKEEDQDMLAPSPPPPPLPPIPSRLTQPRPSQDLGAPAPSSILPPSSNKRRRVTISGAPHALNTDVRPSSAEHNNSTPISPVVMGFTIMRDDPAAIEQVRSMITVKQKQKALIEQRRGSAAGVLVSTGPGPSGPSNLSAVNSGPPSVNVVNVHEDRRPPPKPTPARPERRSPNTGATGNNSRRVSIAPLANQITAAGSPDVRPPSPSPMIVPSQQPQISQNQPAAEHRPLVHASSMASSNSLPPPPISFARRRASKLGAIQKKPADIVISPRESHTADQLAPTIQSAPPVPHAGQSQSFMGRFPMTLPRLPQIMRAEQGVRRFSASQVPPTPTRLGMQRNSAPGPSSQLAGSGALARSPPAASVPIATTLIPPTPSSLHHPSYSGDKSAFLAPFEIFYDALNDSKQLKNWLSEQMQKSNALLQTLTQQQERLDDTVERLVEKKMSGVRAEVNGLYRRVEELEDALRVARADPGPSRRQSIDVSAGVQGKGRPSLRNGLPPVPVAPSTYTFPPVDPPRTRPEPLRRIASPSWGREGESQNIGESEHGSPAPFEANRRLSISAMRLDPPRPPPESVLQSRPSFSGPSGLPPPPSVHRRSSPLSPKSVPSSRLPHPLSGRPPLQRQNSSSRTPTQPPQPPQAGSNAEARPTEQSSSPKLAGSRRNSIIPSPPEDRPHAPMDES